MIDDGIIAEFSSLHEKFVQDSTKLTELQRGILMGMRDIGVGCETKETKTRFLALKKEIEDTLANMKKICERIE
jgi:hypothetical protein